MEKLLNFITIEMIVSITIYVAFGVLIIPLINKIVKKSIAIRYRKKTKSKQQATITKLLQNIIKYVGWTIVLIGILGSLGINTSALIASAGVLGFAIGFGAQSLITDIIAGLFLIVEDQLDVGDTASINGFKGTIMEIGLKTTKIKNWLGEVKYISNGKIDDVINYSKENPFVYIDVPITYEEKLPKALKVIEQINKKLEKEISDIISPVEILGVNELADSSVNIRILAETKKESQFEVKRKMLEIIKNELDKNKITIPYPHIEIIGDKNGNAI